MAPTARFSYLPTTVYVGTRITLTNQSSPGTDANGAVVPITSTQWTLPDGSQPTGSSPTYTFPTAGSFTISLTVTDQNGQTNTASQTVTVTDPVTTGEGKWIKVLTPDYDSAESGEQQSYLRLGAIPTGQQGSELGAFESNGNEKAASKLAGANRHGWYSYTSGNRLDVTDGDREVWIGGSNRFSIQSGGLGVFDAEPIYGLYFRSTDPDDSNAAWRKTEWGRQKSDSYWFGDTESWFGGFSFGAFVGLQGSMMLGGNISMSAAVSLSASVGASMSFAKSWNISQTDESSYVVAEDAKTKARNKIVMRVKSSDFDSGTWGNRVTTGLMAIGVGATVIGGVASLTSGMVQASNEVSENGKPDGTTTGFAIGGAALALAGVLAMSGVLAYKVIRDRLSKTTDDAWLQMDKNKKIWLGNSKGEIYIAPDGKIWLGEEEAFGAQLKIDPVAKQVTTQGGNFTFNFNSGALTISP